MITKQQLADMSDFDVNKALCALLGKDVSGVDEQRNMMTGAVDDYCNNPSDIMPLAFEHNVSLIKMLSDWRACTNNGIYVTHSFDDKNPLRATACCLILVLQDK